ASCPILGDMTIRRMDNVGIVVDNLAATVAFFVELGLELGGEMTVEGPWVDRVVGLDGVRTDIAMMRTPDGHGGLELMKFRGRRRSAPGRKPHQRNRWAYVASCSPSTTSRMGLPACAPMAPNSLARWRSTRTSIGS